MDGDKYLGEWKDGKRNGQETCTWGVEEHNVKLLFMEDCTTPKLESTFDWLLTAPW